MPSGFEMKLTLVKKKKIQDEKRDAMKVQDLRRLPIEFSIAIFNDR